MNWRRNRKPSKDAFPETMISTFHSLGNDREGLAKMKLVFQENPKFGDEQDVTQQIVAIEESIEKLLAEIKRFEVSSFPYQFQSNLSLF